jgi:hypothetical protein
MSPAAIRGSRHAGSPESRAGFQRAKTSRSVIGAAAHLGFHPVGIAEEQRPFVTQPLDLADLLGAGDAESPLDVMKERGLRSS